MSHQLTNKQSRLNVQLLFLGSLSSELGSSIFSYGLSFYVLDQTQSVYSFALSAMITPFVSLLSLPFVGPLVDRASKKHIFILSQSFSLLCLLLYAATFSIFDTAVFIPTICLLVGLRLSDQFTATTRQASIRQLVSTHDLQRVAANTQAASSFSLLVSAALGALLYSTLPFPLFLVFELLAETLALICFCRLSFRKKSLAQRSPLPSLTACSNWVAFREGLLYLRQQPYLLSGICCATLINFISGIYSVGLPLLVMQQLAASKLQYGWVETAHAAGFLLTSLLLGKLPATRYPLANLWQSLRRIGCLLFGISFIPLLPFSVAFPALLALLMLTGGVFVWLNIPYTVWLQEEVPSKMQGRLFSLLSTLGLVSAPLGVGFYGFLFSLSYFKTTNHLHLLFFGTGCCLFLLHFCMRFWSQLDLKKATILRENEYSKSPRS